MQTRRQSALEAILNIGSGFVIAFLLGRLIYPAFGYHPDFLQNLWLTLIFTVVSIIRSYFWRRYFNWRHSTYVR